jgi:hypothetical protein
MIKKRWQKSRSRRRRVRRRGCLKSKILWARRKR